MLKIDGSYGEGGGQILRTALFLSLITGKPFHAFNIRKGRKKPGLKPQHLNILKALQKLTSSKIENARPGSTEIRFTPGKLKGGRVFIDFQTAGSIPLFMQTILPVSLFASSKVDLTVRGGTDVPMSMTFDYFRYVIVPEFEKLASELKLDVKRRGFYPGGGGEVRLVVRPAISRDDYGSFEEFVSQLRRRYGPILRDRIAQVRRITFYSIASRHLKGRRVAHRQLMAAEKVLSELKVSFERRVNYVDAYTPGSAIAVVAESARGFTIGADGIGKRGVPSETVGREAAIKLLNELKAGASADAHLEDNLIPLMGLLGGHIYVREVTEHAKTNMWVTEMFIGARFEVKRQGPLYRISVSSM